MHWHILHLQILFIDSYTYFSLKWIQNFFKIISTKFSFVEYSPKNALAAINKKITHENPHTAGFGLLVSKYVWMHWKKKKKNLMFDC